MTDEGVLIIQSRQHRTQEQNRQEAMLRLIEILRRAAQKPKPRKETRPSKASKERRLDKKRQRGKIKKLRQKPRIEMD